MKLTVKELHAKLGQLIEADRGDYLIAVPALSGRGYSEAGHLTAIGRASYNSPEGTTTGPIVYICRKK